MGMSDKPDLDAQTLAMKRFILWVPLVIAAIFFGFFTYALFFGNSSPQQRAIESQLIGQPMPEFALEPSLPGRPGLSSADLATGEPRLVNFFASWCVPCIAEAPQLMQLREAGVAIDAIAVRDRPEDVFAFLQRWGDPYERIGADTQSEAQLALGSSGVPETFVVDGNGVIVRQHIGDIRPEHVPELLAALEDAR
jgi:cytochrome c biogenesis protein CcmG, thiol:disulfide interchange protein DsbE